MSLQFIKSIILTPEESTEYETLVSTIPIFKSGDKENLTNVSPLYRLSLVQNSKYTNIPVVKTQYVNKSTYPKNLQLVINELNRGLDTNRVELLALKSILMKRLFKSKEVKEVSYDEFMIQAGSVLKCVYCAGTQITIENKSKRSADEPTETFYKCQDCKKEFYERIKYNN